MRTSPGASRPGRRRDDRALDAVLDGLAFDGTPRALTEPLRALAARHELRTGSPLPRTTAVASPLIGEDTDIVAHALSALVAREYERRVCRVSGNWIAPSSARDDDCGLRELLDGAAPLSDALRCPPGEPRLATFRATYDHTSAVQVADVRRLVARLGEEFDHVVLEAPGLLAHHASEIVLGESDGYVLVVRRGTSTEGQVTTSTALAADSPCLGAVLTDYGRRRMRRAGRSRSRRR
jgi:hypothetical protein